MVDDWQVCLIVHFGTNNPETEYELNSLKLKKSKYERDLGINFEINLKRRLHIISKARILKNDCTF